MPFEDDEAYNSLKVTPMFIEGDYLQDIPYMIMRSLNENPVLRPSSQDMLSEIFSWILFSHIDNKDEVKALDMIEKGGFDIDYKTRG